MTAASAGSIQGPRSSIVSTSLLGPILPTVVSDSMPLPLVVTLRLCILLAATARIGSGICFKGGVLRLAVSLAQRSEEHTSELQSQSNLVCRLLLEKKKKRNNIDHKSKHKQAMCMHAG